MFQKIPIALTPEKAGNISENLLNEIQQIICSLYQAKEIMKRVHNKEMKSMKV